MQILLSVLTIVLSACLSLGASLYIARRELRRRERVTFLLDAYRTLAACANREVQHDPRALERAISDVQLLGTPAQAALASQFVSDLAASRRASLDALLDSLRVSLRSELGLAQAPEPKWLRIEPTQSPGATSGPQ